MSSVIWYSGTIGSTGGTTEQKVESCLGRVLSSHPLDQDIHLAWDDEASQLTVARLPAPEPAQSPPMPTATRHRLNESQPGMPAREPTRDSNPGEAGSSNARMAVASRFARSPITGGVAVSRQPAWLGRRRVVRRHLECEWRFRILAAQERACQALADDPDPSERLGFHPEPDATEVTSSVNPRLSDDARFFGF